MVVTILIYRFVGGVKYMIVENVEEFRTSSYFVSIIQLINHIDQSNFF